jgi:hypothetical protein
MHQPVQLKSLSWRGKVDNSLILQHPPHVQAPLGRIRGILERVVIILINAPARIRTRDLWLRYHIQLHAPTSSTQKQGNFFLSRSQHFLKHKRLFPIWLWKNYFFLGSEKVSIPYLTPTWTFGSLFDTTDYRPFRGFRQLSRVNNNWCVHLIKCHPNHL